MTTHSYVKEFLEDLEQRYREAGKIASAEVIARCRGRARGRKPKPPVEQPKTEYMIVTEEAASFSDAPENETEIETTVTEE